MASLVSSAQNTTDLVSLTECLQTKIFQCLYDVGRWYAKTFPCICKTIYCLMKTNNLFLSPVKCCMVRGACIVHRDEQFYRSNPKIFAFICRSVSEKYHYIHFRTPEDVQLFLRKYSDFFRFGHTCCSGKGIRVSKR